MVAQSVIQDIYPLSPMQQGMLFHSLYDAKVDTRHVEQAHFVIGGKLDNAIFERAWNHIVSRHASLRTAILWEEVSTPVQVVHKQVHVAVDYLDWRGWTAEQQQERLTSYLQAERRRGFDVSEPRLLRVSCIHLALDHYRVVLNYHHLILDGWSLPLMIGEVFLCYDALSHGNAVRLNPVRQYKDYIAWLLKQDRGEAEKFWRSMLHGFVTPTPLGNQHAFGSQEQWVRAKQKHTLSAQTTRLLQSIAHDNQLTLNTICQGAWSLLLSQYSGQQDIVFGAVVSGRPAHLVGAESIVGLFINTLPVRVKLDAHSSLLDWLKELQEQQIDARQYEYSSLTDIQLWSEIPRGHDLFHSLFVFENYFVSYDIGTMHSGLTVNDMQAFNQMYYPLTFLVMPGQQLELELTYASNSFEDKTIENMLAHMTVLLEAIPYYLTKMLTELPLFPEEEYVWLVQTLNKTTTDYPREATIVQLFEGQVAQCPDAIALVYEERQMSYAELNRRANQLGHWLRRRGVGPDVCVGIYAERSPEMIVGLLAILKAGGAYLPLDTAYPAERLAFMLEDAHVSLLLTQQSLASLAVRVMQVFYLDSDWSLLAQEREDLVPGALDAANLAYVIYTSGSTGIPKGVSISHQAVIRLLCETNYIQLTTMDRIAQASTTSFDAATFEIWGALVCGARLVGIGKELVLSPLDFAARLREQQITTLFLTTALFNQIARLVPNAFEGLRQLLFGGEAVEPRWVRDVLAAGGPERLLHVYGPTESTTYASWYQVHEVAAQEQTIPIGYPLANTHLYVLNAQLQPVPVGVCGELYIGGDGLARGYLNRGALTAERFVPHPLSTEPGARLYKTGDLVRHCEDGAIEFVGRLDQQVKIRGLRIELGEIEVLLEQEEAIEEALVVVREEGEGRKRLVAYIVLKEGERVEQEALQQTLGRRLPDYMVPSAYVYLDRWPLTANGKVDRHALPAPDEAHQREEHNYAAARNATEQQLVTIWQEVLGVERVGIHDNFFALGGDSIVSIQIVSRARQAGIHMTPRHLFQYTTIAALAADLAQSGVQPQIEAEQEQVSGDVPLTPIQHWFFEQEQPDPEHWNQMVLLTLPSLYKPAYLRAAVAQLLMHHDALRLRFTRTSEWWQQFNAAVDALVPLCMIDLSKQSAYEQDTAIEKIVDEMNRSLNLEHGPLLRVVYFRLGAEYEGRLLLLIHHLVVDGVSWRILLEDLQSMYSQLSQGKAIQLPAKTNSWRQWAHRLLSYAQGEEIVSQIDYWRQQVQQPAAVLLVDSLAGENTIASEQSVLVSLTQQETMLLLQNVSQTYHAQINEILLTVLVWTLQQWTGESVHRVDVEGHGREDLFADLDMSRTVGWFTSIFPIVLKLEAESSLDAALGSVKEQLRALPQSGVGYGILRYLRQDDELLAFFEKSPKSSISFNYLGQFAQGMMESMVDSQGVGSSGRSPQGRREHLLEVNAMVSDGRFHLSWSYSANRHRRETIVELAQVYMRILRLLIAQSQSKEAHGYIPSDFPMAHLSQEQVNAFVGRGIEAIFPLSPLQQGLLFQNLYAPHSGDYIVQVRMTLQGTIKAEAFIAAWQSVVQRHSIFRAAFVWENVAEPLHTLYQQVKVPFALQDWRSYTTEEQEKYLQQYIEDDRMQDFDLGQVPLMRFALIHVGEQQYEFFWTHHHLLLDGWSLPIVLKDVFTAYAASIIGEVPRWEPTHEYQSYIGWLQRQDLGNAERFWRRYLHNFTTPVLLGKEFAPRHIPDGAQYNNQLLFFPLALTQALNSFARAHNLTLNTILLGAWTLLLARYSGQEDIVFGTTVSGRSMVTVDVDHMVGLLINTLPVRVRLTEHMSRLSWLQVLQEQQSEMRQYEYSSLSQIQNWSELPHGTALFESLFVFENYPLDLNELTQDEALWRIRAAQTYEQTHYPLTCIVIPGQQLGIKLLYDRTRFADEAILRMLKHVETVLEEFHSQAMRPLAQLSLLTAREREQILVEWNATSSSYPSNHVIHRLFEEQVQRAPDAIALVYEERQMSYAELNRRANQLGHWLRRRGVGPDVCVGIYAERSLEMIVGLLAILKAGGAYLPLDTAYPAERLAFMLEDAHVSLLLTQQSLASLAVRVMQVFYLDSDWSLLAQEREDLVPGALDAANLAYVIYTSGSTGIPKGVSISHQAVIRLLCETNYIQLTSMDRIAQASTTSFDAATFEIWGALVCGARLVGIGKELVLSPLDFAARLREQQITTLFLTTALFNQIARLVPNAFEGLRQLLFGGEAVEPRWVRDVLAAGGPERLLHVYGPTESTTYASWYQVHEVAAQEQTIPIGYPLANTHLYVLNAQLQPVPVGVCGELYIGGDGLARGYLNRGALTAERFVPHPLSTEPGARLYKTGDLVRHCEDGAIEFVGRLDQQVKIRGLRIELGEIEVLLEQEEAIEEALVVVREEGEGRKRLVAYIILKEGERVEQEALQQTLGRRLPDYMVPSAYVYLDRWPLTANGKVDRHALPAPDEAHQREEHNYAAARNATEQQLVTIWQEVLGVERVGIHDNFFALGGDSIVSIQIVSRARQAGIHMTPRHLFQHPTIKNIFDTLVINEKIEAEQGSVSGDVPLTPIQHWFFQQNLFEPQHLNQAMFLQVPINFDPKEFQHVLALVLNHHDAFRLSFRPTSDGWLQTHTERPSFAPVSKVDLSNVDQHQHKYVLENVADQVQASLDITAGPLLRVVYFDLGREQAGRILIVVHHLVIDAFSWRILLEDVQNAYRQQSQGERVQLPPKTSSWQQWAQRLQEYAQEEDVSQQHSYWLQQVQACPESLPVDWMDGKNTVASIQNVLVALTPQETKALLQEVPQVYHTQINDILLAALALTLHQWTGRKKHVVALEGHGREDLFTDIDISRTVGWFTCLYPVVLSLTQSGTHPDQVLKAIKEQLRAIPAHGIGYGLLHYLHRNNERVEELKRGLQPQISFNYLGQYDQMFAEPDLFVSASESSGLAASPLGEREYLIDVNSSITNGHLQMVWTYSTNRHREETMDVLAQSYIQTLRALIRHCQMVEYGGYTPSDFPLAHLSQEQLDRIIGKRRDVEALYPLSPLQQGLLFQSLYAPGKGDYITQINYTLQGSLHFENFREAWQQLVNHYTILRTSYRWEHLEEPLQMVQQKVVLPFLLQDWRVYSEEEQQERFHALLQADRQQGFDLALAPLMRVTLLQMGEDRYELLWTHHHLLLDGWSLPIVFNKIFANYDALVAGKQIHHPAVPPYQDYIAWLQRQDYGSTENFWQRWLDGFDTPTPLGINHLPDEEQSTEEHSVSLQQDLSVAMTQALHSFSRAYQLTLNTVFLGAWSLLLARYSGQEDLVFGITVSGRPQELPGVEQMVGLFINTLPMRVRLAGEMPLLSWLKMLQEQQSELRQYEYSPLVQTQNWSQVPRGTALFESLFVFENYPLVQPALMEGEQQLHITAVRSKEQIHYPLTLMIVPQEQFLVKVLYKENRFTHEAIANLLKHLQVILQNILDLPAQNLRSVELLTQQERERLLFGWNATKSEYATNQCIHQLIEEQVQRSPDAIALVCEEMQISYSELERRSNQLARLLRQRGVGPELLVGLCMRRSVEMVVALLGILKVGAAYVPLDSSYPADRIQYQLADAQICLLITQESLLTQVPHKGVDVLCLDRVWPELLLQDEARLQYSVSAEHLAYVIYTSGSTGRPKGVGIVHRSTVNLLHWSHATFAAERLQRVLASTSLCFDLSIYELFVPLSKGGSVIIVENVLVRPDYLAQQGITLINTVPSAIAELVRAGHIPNSVRTINLAGEALARSLVTQLYEQTLVQQVYNLYGPTEDTTYSTVALLRHDERGVVPIGYPRANTQAYVLDHALRLVPVGVTGHLYLAGAGIARGYHNHPELTAERFVPHPFSTLGARLYKTGDLARYLADGTLQYVGRADQQVKVRGYRIELGEIESALDRHEAVREAVVLAYNDDSGNKMLVAYIIPVDMAGFSWEAVRMDLKRYLPDYMLPTLHCVLAAFPLGPNGKIDKRALLATEKKALTIQVTSIAPRTEVEKQLADIWQRVLKVEQVGMEANFFLLGGHSLLATQITSHILTVFGLYVPLAQIFERPDIVALAEYIEEARRMLQTNNSTGIKKVAREQYQRKVARGSFARKNGKPE